MAALRTTVIGSMAKPDYLKIPCWVGSNGKMLDNYVAEYRNIQQQYTFQQLDKQVLKATKEAIECQHNIGISVGTDGEMARDNYIYGFCRTLNGFDFENDTEVMCRNGAWVGRMPKIVDEISAKSTNDHVRVAEDWARAQKMCPPEMELKFTLPGPITIFDTMKNEFYENKKTFATHMVKFVNEAVLSLVNQGCKYIQIDEPLLSRYPEDGLEYGVKLVEKCFEGVPDGVTKIVHLCCGYPMYLDQADYQKADQSAYMKLAEVLDESIVDQVSLEDAHRRNNGQLFRMFKKTTVILGVVAIAQSRIETMQEIKEHIKDVLKYIPREQLVIAPDCGLIYLPNDIMEAKLLNMVEAAKSI